MYSNLLHVQLRNSLYKILQLFARNCKFLGNKFSLRPSALLACRAEGRETGRETCGEFPDFSKERLSVGQTAVKS